MTTETTDPISAIEAAKAELATAAAVHLSARQAFLNSARDARRAGVPMIQVAEVMGLRPESAWRALRSRGEAA